MAQVQQQQVAPATYDFSAEPRVIKSKSKYRDSRGLRSSGSNEAEPGSRSSGQKTNTLLSKITNRDLKGELQGFEEPVLEEIVDRPIDDPEKLIPYYFVDRPPTPDYRPLPKGRDIETQVEDHELFDYRLEVKPILEVLVGRTLEQSRIELLEEYEAEQELQHRREFEKRRNAELMVTQRKENEWLRKEAERKRRQKQHHIEEEDKRITHQKYIARIYAKRIIFGMRDQSLQVLNDQGFLRHERPITFRNSYLPYLLKYANRDLELKVYLQTSVKKIATEVQKELVDKHGSVVRAELARRQNIRDERQREAERIERERRERRERRRRLRIFYAKKALREEIEEKIVKAGKEVEDLFAAEVTDISGGRSAKETIGIVGGYIAELCFLLQTLTSVTGGKPIADYSQMVKFFTVFFNDVLKQEKFDIFVPDEYREIFEEFERFMHEDLAEFNRNKDANIMVFLDRIPDVNLAESLSILNQEGLFDHHTFRVLNMALFSLYFTSVDYKPPEKKIPQQNPDADPQAQNPDQGDGNNQVDGNVDPNAVDNGDQQDNGDGANGDQQGDAQDGGDQGAGDQPQGDGGDQPQGDGGDQGDQQQPQQQPEEEWKAPEITEEDLQMVKARERLRLVFVPQSNPEDQVHEKPQYNTILRMRMPLDRELHTVRSQDTHVSAVSKQTKQDSKAKPDDKKQPPANFKMTPDTKPKDIEDHKDEPPVVEKRQLPPEPEDFIEPYDGKTFEKQRAFFPEMEISPDVPQARAFNQQIIPGKKFAQSNHRGQWALTKALLGLLKEFFPEIAGIKNDEEIIAKVRELYVKGENAVLAKIIHSYDDTPVFDYEIY